MRIRVGRDCLSSRRAQRRMHRLGVVLGLRSSYREMGRAGLWLACLSRTPDVESAMEMYNGLIGR